MRTTEDRHVTTHSLTFILEPRRDSITKNYYTMISSDQSTPSIAGCLYTIPTFGDCTALYMIKLLTTKGEAPKSIRYSVKQRERITASGKVNFRVDGIWSYKAKEFASSKRRHCRD